MVNSVYNYLSNYYMSTYGSKPSTRYDSHKRTELKNVYKQMMQYNKETPYYKINLSADMQQYAIDVKEISRDLHNAITSISNKDSSLNIFNQKQLASDSPNVKVTYVGEDAQADYDTQIHLEVESLATTQINRGNFLASKASNVSGQTYSFSLGVDKATYEFEFYVPSGETNLDIQNRLAKLINTSKVGVNAEVVFNETSKCALQLESVATGSPQKGALQFTISSNQAELSRGLISTLGLDQVAQYPKDAHFYIDGDFVSTHGNSFTIDQKYQVTLMPGALEDKNIAIGFQTDSDAIKDNISDYVSSYNNMITFASKNNRLFQDVHSVTRSFHNDLEALGLNVQDNGTISIDDSLLTQSIMEEDASHNFKPISVLNRSLSGRIGQMQMDPFHYVDKLMVSYPNPGKTYPAPYVPSHYSGMLFNSYC